MNKKRYEILNRCFEKLSKIAKNLSYYNCSRSDFDAICEICKYFTKYLDDDEVFTSTENVKNFFEKIEGFSVEECDGQYHIFIEDKETENYQFVL